MRREGDLAAAARSDFHHRVAGFFDGQVAAGSGYDGVGWFFAKGGGNEGGGEAVDVDDGTNLKKGTGFVDGIVTAGSDHDPQLRVGREGTDRHRDIVTLRAARGNQGDGPFDPGGMDGCFGSAISDQDRDTETARNLQRARMRILLNANHGNTELLQFLSQAQADLSHADDDDVTETRHSPPAEDGNVAAGKEVVDDAGGK